jgi:hypothetical protein
VIKIVGFCKYTPLHISNTQSKRGCYKCVLADINGFCERRRRGGCYRVTEEHTLRPGQLSYTLVGDVVGRSIYMYCLEPLADEAYFSVLLILSSHDSVAPCKRRIGEWNVRQCQQGG